MLFSIYILLLQGNYSATVLHQIFKKYFGNENKKTTFTLHYINIRNK